MPIDKGTQGKLCSKNLDEAFCILKGTGVLIEKTLMYIFSKIQLFEVQPCADPESYVRAQELEVRSLYHLYSLKTKSSQCHYVVMTL